MHTQEKRLEMISVKNLLLKYNKKGSFFNHSKNYLIAEFFNKGLSFLTIPIFTRLLLPEEYGIIAVFTSIISIFTVLMGMNFHGSVSRNYFEEDNNFPSFVGTNIFFLFFTNIILLVIFFLFRGYLSAFFVIDRNIFFFATIVSSLSVFITIEMVYFQASQQSGKYALLSIIRNVSMTLIAVVWVYLLKDNRYMGRIYAQLVSVMIIFIFVIINLIRLSKFNFKIGHIKYALLFGVPLIPHALSGFVLAQFDRVIINQISGSYETGLYSFAYNIGMLMNVFIMSMNQAWNPIFYKHLKNSAYNEIQALSEKYVKVTFLIAFLLILFSKEIVIIMADEKYFKSLEILPIIIIGYLGVFLYTLFSGYAFYRKKTGLISLFTFIAGFTNIGLNYLFIPKYGYIAAAWTTLFSYYLLFTLHYINAKFILKEKVIKEGSIFINLSVLISIVSIFLLIKFDNYFLQLVFKLVLIALILLIYFYKKIIKMVQK